MKKSRIPTVLEKFLLPSPYWQESYDAYRKLLDCPGTWLYFVHEKGSHLLVKLDRRGGVAHRRAKLQVEKSERQFLKKYAEQMASDEDLILKLPSFFKAPSGRMGIAFSLIHLGSVKAFLFFTGLRGSENRIRSAYGKFLQPIHYFLSIQTELAYKNFELNNFYETVHPRALALSTMHSLHRVISTSLRLKDLLPRIGRLSAQVLKAQGCSILLTDATGEYLVPAFSFGVHSKFIHRNRLRVGRGIEGRMAKTGEFVCRPQYVGVPFIDDDVVGILLLWNKVDRQTFSQIDLEILKSLSEQAVVAIKNAQLYEQTEELTVGSIKTINELMERHFGGTRGHLAVVGEIVLEIGKRMGLTGYDMVNMERAILLLDSGQLVSDEKTWEKKGRLTRREYEEIKSLPMKGANLLKSISSLKPVIPIIMHRHERFDGKGYPQGLRGDEIPIGARIVSVVDSFMAMILRRHYREALSISGAKTEIELHRGSQFDPEVVNTFLKVMENDDIVGKVERIQRRSERLP